MSQVKTLVQCPPGTYSWIGYLSFFAFGAVSLASGIFANPLTFPAGSPLFKVSSICLLLTGLSGTFSYLSSVNHPAGKYGLLTEGGDGRS